MHGRREEGRRGGRVSNDEVRERVSESEGRKQRHESKHEIRKERKKNTEYSFSQGSGKGLMIWGRSIITALMMNDEKGREKKKRGDKT